MKQTLIAMMLLPTLATAAQARPIDWQAELDRSMELSYSYRNSLRKLEHRRLYAGPSSSLHAAWTESRDRGCYHRY